MICVNPNNPRFQEILKRVNNPLLAEREYNKLYSQENSLFGLDNGDQKNLEFQAITINTVSDFLTAAGVEQRFVSEFLSKDGNIVEGALAAANFIDSTVDIIDDAEKRPSAWNKLPEEAAHWWYRLLKESSPLKKMLWDAHETAVKADELYKGKYGKLEGITKPEDLTEEAIGQLIAEGIKRIENKKGNKEDYSFLKNFLSWINKLLAKFNIIKQDPFDVAAMKILSSDMSDLLTVEEYNNFVKNSNTQIHEGEIYDGDYLTQLLEENLKDKDKYKYKLKVADVNKTVESDDFFDVLLSTRADVLIKSIKTFRKKSPKLALYTDKGYSEKDLVFYTLANGKSGAFIKATNNSAFKDYYYYLDYKNKITIGRQTYYFLTDNFSRGTQREFYEQAQNEMARKKAAKEGRYTIRPTVNPYLSPRIKKQFLEYVEEVKKNFAELDEIKEAVKRQENLIQSNNVRLIEAAEKEYIKNIEKARKDNPEVRKNAIESLLLSLEPGTEEFYKPVFESLPTIVLVNLNLRYTAYEKNIEFYKERGATFPFMYDPFLQEVTKEDKLKLIPNTNTFIPVDGYENAIEKVNKQIINNTFDTFLTAEEKSTLKNINYPGVRDTKTKAMAVALEIKKGVGGTRDALRFVDKLKQNKKNVINKLKSKLYEKFKDESELLKEYTKILDPLYNQYDRNQNVLYRFLNAMISPESYIGGNILQKSKITDISEIGYSFSIKLPDGLNGYITKGYDGGWILNTGFYDSEYNSFDNEKKLTDQEVIKYYNDSATQFINNNISNILASSADFIYDAAIYSPELTLFNSIAEKLDKEFTLFNTNNPKDRFREVYTALKTKEGLLYERLKFTREKSILERILDRIIQWITGNTPAEILENQINKVEEAIKGKRTVISITTGTRNEAYTPGLGIFDVYSDDVSYLNLDNIIKEELPIYMLNSIIDKHSYNHNKSVAIESTSLPEGIDFSNVKSVNLPNLQAFPVDFVFSHQLEKLYAPNVKLNDLPTKLKDFVESSNITVTLQDYSKQYDKSKKPGLVDKVFVSKAKSNLLSKKESKYSFDHEANLYYDEKSFPYYTLGKPGKKFKVEFSAPENTPFPKDLYEKFKLSHGGKKMISDNPIGWFSGKIDDNNLYITEVQSDLLQRTYELSNKWLDEHGFAEDHPFRKYTNYKSKLENYYNGWLYVFTGTALQMVLKNNPNIKTIYIPTSETYRVDVSPSSPYQYYDKIAAIFPSAKLSEDGKFYEIDRSDMFSGISKDTKGYYDVIIKSAISAGLKEQKEITPDLDSDRNLAKDIMSGLVDIDILSDYLKSKEGIDHLNEISDWIEQTYSDEKPVTDDTKGGELVDAEGNIIEEGEEDEKIADLIKQSQEINKKQAKLDVNFLLDELSTAIKNKDVQKQNFIKKLLEQATSEDGDKLFGLDTSTETPTGKPVVDFDMGDVSIPTEQEQSSIISQNIINAIAEQLSLNLGVGLTNITSQQAREMDPNWNGEPAFYLNGQVYIVDGAMTLENVFHEFSHPLFDAIYMSNKKLFDKLYAETIATPEGAAIVATVRETYPEYDENGDMFQKEVMVRALTAEAQSQTAQQESTKTFKATIKKILFAIKQMLRDIFGKSIKIEKLDVNTSLKDLAKMLKGERFDINTDLVSPKDVAQYARDISGYVKSFENLENDKLLEMVDNLNRETLKSIAKVKSSKNIEDIRNKLITDNQQGVLDRLLETISKGTSINEAIAKLEDEEKKRSLNTHNFVLSILQIQQFVVNLDEHLNTVMTTQQGQQLVSSLNAYQKLISNWSDFVNYTTESLLEKGMDRNSEMGTTLTRLQKQLDDLNNKIVKGYGPGVVTVLKEALMPLINTLQKHYAEHLKEVEERYAKNPSEKLKKYIENLKKERDNFLLDDKKIKDLMVGRYGDTNVFSAYLEAYTNSPDPIVGGLAVFIKNAYTDVENRFQSDMQDFKKEIGDLLEKAGYSRNLFTAVNEKLVFKNKTYYYNTVTDELEEREEYTFLNPLKDETFYIAQFKQQYEEAKAAGDKQLMEEIRIAEKKHRRKYFHQKYKTEFYEREDIYDDFNKYFDEQQEKYEQSLIAQGIAKGSREFRNKLDGWRKREDVRLVAYEVLGIDPSTATAAQVEEVNRFYADAAAEAMKRKTELLIDIGVKQNESWDEENFEEVAEELEQNWRQYGRLASQTDMLGNPKVGKEKLMSAIERKYRRDTNEFYTWEPKENAFEIALDKFEQTLLNAGIAKGSPEWNEKRDIWIKKNTVISYTAEWYQERNEKIIRLKELMAKLPEETRKKIDTTEELELLLGLSVGFRDKDGQIIGDEMSDASKQKVKDLQEAILEKRSQMAGLSGLDRDEMNDLTNLFTKIRNRTGLTSNEQMRLDHLLAKQDRLGLSKGTKAEMARIFSELADLQQKEPTTYYLDAMNNWLELLGEPPIDEIEVENFYKLGVLDELFNRSPEFKEWFEKNHLLRETYDSANPGGKILQYERIFIWNRTRPTDPSHYENFELTTGEVIQGKPSLAYEKRVVKPQYVNEKIVGKTVNNLGNGDGAFLPKSKEDGAPADSPYINEQYYELQRTDPKLFDVLEKMKEYHLKWQQDALPESRLYLAIPKYRTKSSEALIRVSKGVKRWKQWFYNIRSWFKGAPDDQELGLNYDPEVLAKLEMVDEDVRKLPVSGIYDLDVNEVSLDLGGGLMRYRMGTLKQAKLLELSPAAEAISQYVKEEEFIVKGADKALKAKKKQKKMNRYEKRQAISQIWDKLKRTGQYRKLKRKKSTRLTAIENLLEREFEGITQSEWTRKAPGAVKIKNFVTGAASTTFFALNPQSAFKNKIAAQVQSFIESFGGKYITMRSLARGKWRSFVMLSKHTMEMYSTKSNSLEVQMMQIFNPGQEVLSEYEKDSFVRTPITDIINFSFLTNPRKWLQFKATLDVFNGMMFHQTVDLNYRGNSQKIYYAEAFEMVNGKIRLKEGIDPEWANYHVDHTVARGETAESIAEKYGITKEELYKRNKLADDAELLPGDVLEIGRSRQFKAFKNRMHEITNRLEGAFSKFDRVELDRNFFFQCMIFMKRFFGHMAGNWFAGRRTSVALGDISVGNWPGFVQTINGLRKYGIGYLQFQRSEERAAVKRTLGMVLTLAAFYMLRSFLWDWDFLQDSDEAYEKMKERSGDYFSDDYRRRGFISNSYLALMMGVLTETETWANPVVFINQVKGLPDPGTVSDQALIKPTTVISEYLAYINKDESAFYKQDAGPYSWQKEGEPKWKATLMKMLGFTGANFDPKKGIENLERYQRTFQGTK